MFSPHHYDYDHGENFPFNDREDYNDYGANPGYDEMIDNPFERDFDRNPTALLTMIQKKAWPEAIERTMGHFEEARVWVSRRESDGNLRWRLLPIHAAMVFKAPKNVVKNLLAAYPPGAAAQDDRGMLPLHLAFRTGAPESIVNLLLEAFPQAIDIQDHKGRIPFDLAMASTSPYKEAYMRALERVPTTTEHEAAYGAREAYTHAWERPQAMEADTSRHEIEKIKMDAQKKEEELKGKLNAVEKELAKTQEMSLEMVDQVSSLEDKVKAHSETERVLATKIVTLDSSLKESEKAKGELEEKLKTKTKKLTVERDNLQAQAAELSSKYGSTQGELTKALEVMEKREKEWTKKEKSMTQLLQAQKRDWTNDKANCAILEKQLKKKTESEKALQDERVILRESIQTLTKRLSMVARVLEDMTEEQNRMVKEAEAHNALIEDALTAHGKIVEASKNQEKQFETDREERKQILKVLEKQEQFTIGSEKERSSILDAIAAQGNNMKKGKSARDEMLVNVKEMSKDIADVVGSVNAAIVGVSENDETAVDTVVKNLKALKESESLQQPTKAVKFVQPWDENRM